MARARKRFEGASGMTSKGLNAADSSQIRQVNPTTAIHDEKQIPFILQEVTKGTEAAEKPESGRANREIAKLFGQGVRTWFPESHIRSAFAPRWAL